MTIARREILVELKLILKRHKVRWSLEAGENASLASCRKVLALTHVITGPEVSGPLLCFILTEEAPPVTRLDVTCIYPQERALRQPRVFVITSSQVE